MSSKRFTAVNALLVSVTRNKDGGRAKIKFQYTAKVSRALEWPDIPEGTSEWTPDVDELKSSMIELTPNNEELKSKAVSVDASTIGDFIVVRKKKKAGKNSVKADKTITEVICTVRFTDATGCAKLEQYLQSAARSEMLVCYTPQPVQGELDGTRVDMTPESSQLPLTDLPLTDEAREATNETPAEDGPAPTHAEKLARRKEESERKRQLREESKTVVQ